MLCQVIPHLLGIDNGFDFTPRAFGFNCNACIQRGFFLEFSLNQENWVSKTLATMIGHVMQSHKARRQGCANSIEQCSQRGVITPFVGCFSAAGIENCPIDNL
jgi:hypothetical protein